MPYPDWIQQQAKETHLSLKETAQIFLQVSVLRHLSLSPARFMGGTALVLGYNNPRFSEDIDLTQVQKPALLRPGLMKARFEIEGWFGKPVTLTAPKAGGQSPAGASPTGATWKMIVTLSPSESVRLHIDSQPFKAYTTRPLVIDRPPLSPFVCGTLELDEIMADKIIALACRNYLGGRDLFDLWFHWLRMEADTPRQKFILDLVKKKIRERKISFKELRRLLVERVGGKIVLARAREEWKRYLPADFQKVSILNEIVLRCRRLLEIVS